jgi:hypothetical protein
MKVQVFGLVMGWTGDLENICLTFLIKQGKCVKSRLIVKLPCV